MWESHGIFYFRSICFFFFSTANKKIINSKILFSQSPLFLVLRPRGPREEERAMDTRKTGDIDIEKKRLSLYKVHIQSSQDDEGTLLDTYKSLFT